MAKRRRQWKKEFIEVLRETANVRAAAEKANVSRTAVYKARKNSKVFALEWDNALEDAIDKLTYVAYSRAMKKSDRLLMFLLQAHRKNVYGQKMELSGSDGGPIEMVVDWGGNDTEASS
tara:strand:- start:12987 stop:13343 length:357 start_codon:yes stop_codon:yes gene_type:complete